MPLIDIKRPITEKLREQRRLADERYRKKKKEEGLIKKWVKEDHTNQVNTQKIKKMSEGLNLPINNFKHKDTLNDFIEYLNTGNISLTLLQEINTDENYPIKKVN
jgi:hypothetical protein